jgi:hypothetical protein
MAVLIEATRPFVKALRDMHFRRSRSIQANRIPGAVQLNSWPALRSHFSNHFLCHLMDSTWLEWMLCESWGSADKMHPLSFTMPPYKIWPAVSSQFLAFTKSCLLQGKPAGMWSDHGSVYCFCRKKQREQFQREIGRIPLDAALLGARRLIAPIHT